ncbi:uncharacterized protein HKW66_Vig0195590 [Vigna angularis]|uniref:Ubiquitin-like domain-containing protein n=1 Tax=Phaseolus angularis TaxID=3914 RepID=A0A8T0KU85_PHAAN|nr:uncharacterized protein HKW66_Vig0195590 [Vigna angularis]
MKMMDVNVEIQGGESFSIRLHPSQTIRDIKEIVQHLQGIPVRHQIILHNQQLLYDDLNVQECFIQNGSRIIAQIHADAPSPAVSSEHDYDFSTDRDVNLPSSPSSERHSDFPFPPSRPQVLDLNLPPSPEPLHDLSMPVSPPAVRDLNLPPLRAPVNDLNFPPSPPPSPSLSPSQLNPSHLTPVPSLSPSSLPSSLNHTDLPRVPSSSPSPSPSTSSHSYFPPVPVPTFSSDLKQQPIPDHQIPPFLNRNYNLSDIAPWSPSLQLTETSYEDDPFEIGDFSSSPLLMPMPDTPTMVREMTESVPRITSPSPSTFVPNPVRSVPQTVTINVKVPLVKNRVRIESDRKDTVLELKQKIVALEDMRGVPVDRIVLQLNSMSLELMDHLPLHDCVVAENSQIDVLLKPPC